jgi:hypothetical protein
MARNGFTLTPTAEIALAAATAKTVAQLVAPANTILAVNGAWVSFDGISNTAEPAIVEILTQTTAGTMTSRTPQKTKDTSTALGATGGVNASAEPTAGNVLKTFHVHPQAGVIIPLDFDKEIEIAGGARLGMRITAPAAVNCLAGFEGEE